MSTKIIYLVQGLCSKGSSMVVQASHAFLVQAPPLLIIQAPPLLMISPVLLLLMKQALQPSGHLVPPSRSNSVPWQHLLQCACGLLLLDVIVQSRCSMHNTQQCNSLTVLGVDVVAAGDWRRTAWFAPFVAFACQPLAICLRTLLSLYSQPGDCWAEILVGIFWLLSTPISWSTRLCTIPKCLTRLNLGTTVFSHTGHCLMPFPSILDNSLKKCFSTNNLIPVAETFAPTHPF